MGRGATLKLDIVADAKGVGRGVDQAEGKLAKLGGAAGKVGGAVALGMAAAGAAAVAFGAASIGAASDVEQSFGAVDSVFKESSGQVKAWAEAAATAVGLSKSEYANLAVVVGSQLQNMGRSSAEAAKETDGLVKMGADLAATFGGDVSDAVSAVSSLLKGERDPIERYGVSIKAADVAAGLAAKGLTNLTGKAKAQAEATVTLELLTKQTAAAHGAFGRESDTLAGKQARLKAQFENVKAEVGQKLLPALTAVTGWISEKLLPSAVKLGGQLQEKLGPTLASIGSFISTKVVPAAKVMASYFTENVVPALSKVGGFVTGTLVPALSSLWTWFSTKIAPIIRDTLSPILKAIGGVFDDVAQAVKDNEEPLRKLGNFLGTVIPPVARVLGTIFSGTLSAAFRGFGEVVSGIISGIGRLVDLAGSAVDKIKGLASAANRIPGIGRLIPGAMDGLLAGPSAALSGRSAPLGPTGARLATAASMFGTSGWTSGLAPIMGNPVIADHRTVKVEIVVQGFGGILDPAGVQRALEQGARDAALRLGRATAYGAA